MKVALFAAVVVIILVAYFWFFPADCYFKSLSIPLGGGVTEECTCLGIEKAMSTQQDQTKTVCHGIVADRIKY